jgi:hypothetical protein
MASNKQDLRQENKKKLHGVTKHCLMCIIGQFNAISILGDSPIYTHSTLIVKGTFLLDSF